MRRPRRVAGLVTGVAAVTAAALVGGPTATAAVGPTATTTTAISAPTEKKPSPGSDVRHTGPDLNDGKPLPLDEKSVAAAKARIAKQNKDAQRKAAGDPEVGDQLEWLALNDAATGNEEQIYLKSYTLRGLGDHVQVWVADDIAFPADDCRNTLGLAEVTDEQVDGFVEEFDTNIYPKESESFSVPPSRDGADSPLGNDPKYGLNDPDYYKVSAAQADDITVLVDNVKDANYNDPSTEEGQTYIAGFFYSVFNEGSNRNIMTIDAFDWLHRTGENPPDDSADPAYVACAQQQGVPAGRAYGSPRPRLYEGTFAHEYQHLLEYYEDPDETAWVNEGLSDYAQTLVGYVDTSTPPDQPGADNHIASFLGFGGEDFGGPENSLTNWEDQGPGEILADYGAAYSFMMYLFDRYGEDFMSDLHRENAGGLAGLQKVLTKYKSTKSAQKTLDDWAALVAVDGKAGEAGGTLAGGLVKKDLTTKSLFGKVEWDNPRAYDAPGAPPNGSDYVRLRDGGGDYLRADEVDTIRFTGSKILEPTPVEWTLVTNAPTSIPSGGSSCGAVPTGSEAAFYSGCGANLDRSIARTVSVPTSGSAKFTFDAQWDAEVGYDYGFVQISTDGGKTWKSQATADTTTDDDGTDPRISSQLPGFNGTSDGFQPQSVDLAKYRGKKVYVAFRYMGDGGINQGGFWVKNVKIGAKAVPLTLDAWKTYSQVAPTKVSGYTVQVVAWSEEGNKTYVKRYLPDANGQVKINGFTGLASSASDPAGIAVLVMQRDPKELVTQQALYTLKVNGVLQPGGSAPTP